MKCLVTTKSLQAKKPKDWSRTQDYKNLKKDMLDDLDARGCLGSSSGTRWRSTWPCGACSSSSRPTSWNTASPWSTRTASNQYGVTDNKSVASITRVSAQMLQIWTALGFRSQATAANAPPAQDSEEDEL